MQSTRSSARLSGDALVSQCSKFVCAQSSFAQEAPPETTTIRLAKIPGICIAPQYVAEELLRSEGFTNIQYVELSVNVYGGFTAGTIDISMAFIAPYIIQIGRRLAAGAARRGARGMF